MWRRVAFACESHPMALRLRRRGDPHFAALLEQAAFDSLSYAPVGVSLDGSKTPRGFHRHQWTVKLGGGDTFDLARVAIDAWAVHRGAGLEVVADGPIARGTNVALIAPLPLGVIEATCRIVVLVDEPERFGFAYGTLSVHPERGEEAFVVRRHHDDEVHFDVFAVSRPAHPLARLAPPVATYLQDRAAHRYLSAMQAATALTGND
jgi:uncharacterized protein (UPF0548 family)